MAVKRVLTKAPSIAVKVYKLAIKPCISRPHHFLERKSKVYQKWLTFKFHKHVHFVIGATAVFLIIFFTASLIQHALAFSDWTQTDWSGGVGTSTTNQYSSDSNAVTSAANQVTLAQPNSPTWYNAAWKYRQQVTFNNTTSHLGVTADNLTNFPVMIKLTSSNFNFSEAQSAGQDIRFTASDGITALNYQIESWSTSSQLAIIWVKVPSITANTNTGSIYMYYGNSSASDGQNVTSTWDSSYTGVWHLDEASGTSVADSTSGNNTGTVTGMTVVPGVIGNARSSVSNSGNYISTPLTNGATVTIQAWATWTGTSGQYGMLWNRGNNDGPDLFFYSGSIFLNTFDGAGNPLCTIPATAGNGQYHLYTLVNSASYTALYYDGQLCGTAGYRNPTGAFSISSGGVNYDWLGAIDEVEVSNIVRSAGYIAASYSTQSNNFATYGSQQIDYSTSGTLTSAILNTGLDENWGNLSYSATIPSNTTVSVLVRAGNQADLSDAPAFTSCSAIASGSAITSSCAPNKSQYVQYQLQFTSDGSATSTFTSVTIPYTPADTTPPTVNASAIAAFRSNGGVSISSDGWSNTDPYFTWAAGQDNTGGSGMQGYCLYLGQDPSGNPITTKGDLGTSPLNTGGACQFAISTSSIDTSINGYIGTALTSSASPYYLNVKAIDNADNVYNGSSAQFEFMYDNVAPTNPAFITAPSEFVSSKQVTLTWSTTGSDAANDDNSGVAGLQYRIGSSGIWYGSNHTGTQDATDLLTNNGSYTTVSTPDFNNLQQGNNIVYFRTWDNAGNVSQAYVTTVIKINSTAPSTPQNLTATPTTNTTNSFGFSWLAPASYTGYASNITYCYTVNVLPTSSNCTFTSAGQTSLDAGAYATEPGDNTFYLVAKDEAGNINYATAASVTFTANTPAPGIPLNPDIADISTKSTSSWKLALSWNQPSTVGAGIATYKVYRSTDGTDFTNIASTAGASYVDANLNQETYYYKIQACDSANNCGGFTNVVSMYPTGKFTSPANLISGPTVSVNTRTATITWTTDRDSDSSVEYGLSSGHYFDTNASNTDQVTSHTVELNNLNPGTTYYYRSLWTDTDGNLGTSAEGAFTTLPAPTIGNVNVDNINLSSATIQFTASNATEVQLDYANNTQNLNTSTSTSTYSIPLTGLTAGTTYTFKLNPYDTSGNIYISPASYSFTTPPQPVITNVEFSPVTGALTGTEQISWTTNVPATSQISYGLLNGSRQNQLDTTLSTNHTMTISGLSYNTEYSVTATSVDALGNSANSDLQVFKSGIDTRPPIVSDVTIQPSIIGTGADAKGQLIVSWKTDKAGTSQVAYGEGTSGDYSTKTAENSALVNNHVVVVSGLATSQVYHLQVISNDANGIRGVSSDQTTIVGQATDNALGIVFNALQSIFGL